MVRLHRDVDLQLLENKALSWGIIRKSACILAEITIRKSQDSSTSTTNQRQHNEVYETPRFSPPDPYRYRHARLAASRRLRENDCERNILSHIQDLSLSTAFY